MTRTVHCVVLGIEAEGLPKPPYPGEIGQRVYENVSAEGWNQWLQRLVMIINEEQLNSADPACQERIEKHMLGFLFREGGHGHTPAGYHQN
jgi:Fe-S cluster biosynthesis and repair protein YggX